MHVGGGAIVLEPLQLRPRTPYMPYNHNNVHQSSYVETTWNWIKLQVIQNDNQLQQIISIIAFV